MLEIAGDQTEFPLGNQAHNTSVGGMLPQIIMNNNSSSRRHVWTAAMFLMGIAGGIGAVKYLPPLGERTTPTRIAAAKPIEQTALAPATQFTAIETKVPEPDPTADRELTRNCKACAAKSPF